MKNKICILLLMMLPLAVFANVTYVSFSQGSGSFALAQGGKSADIVVADNDWKGVRRAAADLAEDIFRVAGCRSDIVNSARGKSVIVGTIGKSALIDNLVKSGQLDVSSVKDRWESYVIQTVGNNLVIAGSDKRGTIYGIYDLSENIGVSPWYWWADVKPMHHDNIFVNKGRYVQESPKVKYRGIFINDEEPSFGSWCRNHFGGYNSKMYTHLFELILRLKANYLWPAMWNARFNEDDELNPRLADEYGVVMGTSHHEPMMRAHKEYVLRKDSIGLWSYSSNKLRIDNFFREGIVRNCKYDNIITLGMRGDGDVAMGNGNDIENMRVLKDVIKGQRSIINDVYGNTDVPQLWAVFTEVQRYYDAGFKVPDDVTLLFCDNNWGYIRRKGPLAEKNRKGGMGLYYHIDMNGGPWNDRWVNTTTIPKLREQLNLAYRSGIDRIWLINVGDLKPKEVPIDFIMHYAWNPDAVKPGDETAYLQQFAESAFGKKHSAEIADIISRYSKYNLWRKPEVETTDYFSIENNDEARHLISLWEKLKADAVKLSSKIPESQKDAFYQLAYYPAVASAGTALIYLYTGMNNYYAGKGIKTDYADKVKYLFDLDRNLSDAYNDSISGGKWHGIMNDVHIGYREWFMPERNALPAITSPVMGHNEARYSLKRKGCGKEASFPSWNYADNVAGKGNRWIMLPGLGRGKGCMGAADVMCEYDGNIDHSPRLEYVVNTDAVDSIQVVLGILPTQDVSPARGLRLAVSVDNATPVIVDARRGLVDTFEEYTPQHLEQSNVLKPLPAVNRHLYLNGYGKKMRNEVFDNMRWLDATFKVNGKKKKHVVKVYMIDPEIVLEQLVVNPDNGSPSYFASSFDWNKM